MNVTLDLKDEGLVFLTSKDGVMSVSKLGGNPTVVVGIYPDRLSYFEATVRWKFDGKYLSGFNESGKRTIHLAPEVIRPGMILASRDGYRSPVIKEVIAPQRKRVSGKYWGDFVKKVEQKPKPQPVVKLKSILEAQKGYALGSTVMALPCNLSMAMGKVPSGIQAKKITGDFKESSDKIKAEMCNSTDGKYLSFYMVG